MGKNVIELDDSNFDAEVLSAEVPVLVDFGATWCGPCRALDPIVHRLADDHVGKLRVAMVDIDDAPRVAQRFGIRGAPTILVFRGGKKTAQHVGVASKERLLELVGAL